MPTEADMNSNLPDINDRKKLRERLEKLYKESRKLSLFSRGVKTNELLD
jgi:hypothetical protein